ncbi:MAG: type II 3-dehydroquinate dehydratase [Chitinophagales bacterium]|nr:type II 3-dehydroquinate dehydratase [Chitinophagales bacterium]
MDILIINGPNLNLLGKREPEIYGNRTFEDYFTELSGKYPHHSLTFYQSNVEGEIINKLQAAGFTCDGIILNAGGYTHTSVAIGDAIAAIKSPVIEVHISNPYAREEYRRQSMLSGKCKGLIAGFGLKGYEMAVRYFVE